MAATVTAALKKATINGASTLKFSSPIVRGNSTFGDSYTPPARAANRLPSRAADPHSFAVPQIAPPGSAVEQPAIVASHAKDVVDAQGKPVPRLFHPLTLRGVTLANRIGLSPMCTYSAQDGVASDWHLVHYGKFAQHGFGLVVVEMTAVSPEARISPYDMGLWNDEQASSLSRVVRFVHSLGGKIGIQLGHSGRKGSTLFPHVSPQGGFDVATDELGGWQPSGVSDIPYDLHYHRQPRTLTLDELAKTKQDFVDAARRADTAGFDVLVLQAGHGYLFSQFLSLNVNDRTDQYGAGSFENRARFLLETIAEIRESGAWPEEKPLFVRLSATEWVDESGWSSQDTLKLAPMLYAAGVDVIDVTTGGINGAQKIKAEPFYQTVFSAEIKKNIPQSVTATVGMFTTSEQAEKVLQDDDADIVFVARQALREPAWPLKAARELGAAVEYPAQYNVLGRLQ